MVCWCQASVSSWCQGSQHLSVKENGSPALFPSQCTRKAMGNQGERPKGERQEADFCMHTTHSRDIGPKRAPSSGIQSILYPFMPSPPRLPPLSKVTYILIGNTTLCLSYFPIASPSWTLILRHHNYSSCYCGLMVSYYSNEEVTQTARLSCYMKMVTILCGGTQYKNSKNH